MVRVMCVTMSKERTHLALFVVVVAVVGFSNAKLPKFEHPVKADGSLSFLVVGDWGRRGNFNQSLVADQVRSWNNQQWMGKIGEKLEIDFVISTGDNFYPDGLRNTKDIAFIQSFTNIYNARSLQKQWYSVLGNHDYRGSALAQLSDVLQKLDRRWFCMRSYILDSGIVQFFFVDTTPFVLQYWNNPFEQNYDWRGVTPPDKYIPKLLKDLNSALKESKAKWKFVVGHHTMRSVSEHGDTDELLTHLLPILKANGVDLYINGHDHCLEHISSKDSPIQYLTSGGGSKAWRGTYTPNKDQLRFFYDGQGFLSIQMTEGEVLFAFYDVYGNVLHQDRLTKEFHPII